jgi:SAM-dependent methyltransferase
MPRKSAPEIAAARRPFEGVTQIVRYNWPYYVLAAISLGVGGLLINQLDLPQSAVAIFTVFVILTVFWALSSIVVSFYVYDLSLLYRWEWLREVVQGPPRTWVSFHAGLDETSDALRRLFPASEGRGLDIYDPKKMTERSIERARSSIPDAGARASVDFRALPFPDATCDAVFLILAAHELRDPQDRVRFFRELRRILHPGGRIILVEHLRDAVNFAAYGPGIRHFFTRGEWLRVAKEGGLLKESERSLTPFVRCFVFSRERGE